MSISQKNRPPFSAETRLKISQALKGRKHSVEHTAKVVAANKDKIQPKHTHATKRKMSRSRKLWYLQHPEKREELRRKMIEIGGLLSYPGAKERWAASMSKVRGDKIFPNKTEQAFLILLDELFPDKWKFVGNFALMINGKCPDFWDGDHKVIEVFGNYWHKGKDPTERINHFKQNGYDCLVIWEHEIRDVLTLQKVREFYYDRATDKSSSR